jgi:hypothetical protein
MGITTMLSTPADTSWMGKWAVRKRRKEAGSTFIWPVIRMHR